MKLLGIIPARAGSKGLKHKNIAPFAGKPLIAHTIEAALESQVLDTLIVSTDSPEIAAVSKHYGASVPWLRPQKLALDETPTSAVLLHALQELEAAPGKKQENYQGILLLQPTSPLRNAYDIKTAYEAWEGGRYPSVISVCQHEHPLAWSVEQDETGKLVFPFQKAQLKKRRQDQRTTYRLNGAIYFLNRDLVLEEEVLKETSKLYEMPAWRSIDIDTLEDLIIAEALYHRKAELQ